MTSELRFPLREAELELPLSLILILQPEMLYLKLLTEPPQDSPIQTA
jgi:hypothetical protein